MNKFVLIDGNSIANRAFYALPLLNNSSGLHTNAVYGFTTMLLKLIEEEKPTHFLVAFDAGKVTFRHKEYKDYKGKRMKTPPELSEQFPVIKKVLDAFGIRYFELEGYEADDIIGTLTLQADQQKIETLVVTGDKDMLQLASDHVTIALTRKGVSETERYDPQAIQDKYGLKPEQIIDLKGLMGDASDNIPGVPGIGEKTGLKLLHQYGSIEEVLAHVDELKGKMKERIIEHEQDARMSKELATIYREMELDFAWDEMKFEEYDPEAVSEVFKELEFHSLLEKMDVPTEDVQRSDIELQYIAATESNIAEIEKQLPHIRALHVEVIGDNPHRSEIAGIGMALDQTCYYVPFEFLQSEHGSGLRQWLSNADQAKWVFDLHKVEAALRWQGLVLKGAEFDVHLAAYLLDPTQQGGHALSGLAEQHGIAILASDDEVYGKGAKFKLPEEEVLSKHISHKAYAVQQLVPKLKQSLESVEMNQLYYDLELPVASLLAEMELDGVRVDLAGLEEYGAELSDKIDRIIEEIYALAGTEFNLNSPKQLGEILFDKLQLPVIKKTKTGYSTDAEVLEKLEPHHQIVSLILEYRQLAKLQSTYVEGLKKEIREDTSKIHTYFRQTIAATGRLSSQYPNLQNIPIRMEEGRKIRKVFIPSEEGWLMLAADYSQIELRVLAHLSQDERLMEAFHQDMDIHTKTAMDVFGVQADEVDSEMRRQAKAVNFGIIYGISDYGLSQNLNIPRKQAAAFIEQYFNVFQGVRKYMDDTVKQAKENGYVATMLNRRRYLPEIRSSNYNMRSFAERTAMNTPIQGTAADIIKLAMLQLSKRMKEEKLASKLLLQVHDELVFEVPPEELDKMKKIVPEVMENALPLDVPLKVEVSYGANWYEAK